MEIHARTLEKDVAVKHRYTAASTVIVHKRHPPADASTIFDEGLVFSNDVVHRAIEVRRL
jgi:hypothetical protein